MSGHFGEGHIIAPYDKGHIIAPYDKGHIIAPYDKGHIIAPYWDSRFVPFWRILHQSDGLADPLERAVFSLRRTLRLRQRR